MHTSFREVLSYEEVTDLSSEQTAVDDLANAIVHANALLTKGDTDASMAVVQDAMNRINNIYQVSQAMNKTR
ncbi:hypothetical protein [Ferrovum myxofaciens]|uniref:hypothetical protein n=1 Tax=Ferrovum myxofaciens TaxID=416213 RepID=UPI003EB788FF